MSIKKTINIDEIVKQVTEQVTQRIALDIDAKLSIATSKIKAVSETTKTKIVLEGKHKYVVQADSDGLGFLKDDNLSLIMSKNGQLGFGIRSPRTVGKGSAHFKMGNSEAVIPSSGKHSTRGVLVESDADDDSSYILRAVSRMNRQGFNVFGNGSLGINTMERLDNATVSLYHKVDDEPCITLASASKYFTGDALNLKVDAPRSDAWNVLNVDTGTGEDDIPHKIFNMSGDGSMYIDKSVYTNVAGYAEKFEWADGNSRNENRYGLVVALDANGQLIAATESSTPIGVVVPNASVIGNSNWNGWKNKFDRDEFGIEKQHTYNIIEWNEDVTGKLKSFYTDSLDANFATPDNAIEYQTDEFGNELKKDTITSEYDADTEYLGRQKRKEWATVCLLGTVPVFKGQSVGKGWILVKGLSDELDLMIVK